jgi:hypothetical protein
LFSKPFAVALPPSANTRNGLWKVSSSHYDSSSSNSSKLLTGTASLKENESLNNCGGNHSIVQFTLKALLSFTVFGVVRCFDFPLNAVVSVVGRSLGKHSIMNSTLIDFFHNQLCCTRDVCASSSQTTGGQCPMPEALEP